MADFNQILTPGDVDGGIINVVNEFHHADNARFQEYAGCQRLFGNEQHVQFIAVFV